ncbi:hypothetical protein A8924_0206 [Saccharopolyspora erythraea NRRL 2338]|uniref:SWIM zinc finger family protein n=1 Tax=Saccharopolyspora erythraea TaxID=1836 RepID=UPI0001D311EF|nr:SWIM zinc finger family protein [Saccharopolyspora erythraea]EQD87725.1 hypothetical protein N599_02930 [Saccharopolyspora erythraea D]PFG92982.1 hypothetical protein A8924_0206 [Saccharopolyspora erythraea NRRL 2338]QRK89873.1 hypothetical protein JQX30_36165 [Saccharopolyspora erythraea]
MDAALGQRVRESARTGLREAGPAAAESTVSRAAVSGAAVSEPTAPGLAVPDPAVHESPVCDSAVSVAAPTESQEGTDPKARPEAAGPPSPGRITASVDGDHDTHRTSVSVEVLNDAEWSRLLDRVVARSGHIAALLDGEMPRELVESADDAGVRLLPGIGDLEPDCDCPGFEHPCRHAAALGHQVSWLLDADPFVMLLARGRGREELLAELRWRRTCAEPDAPLLEPGELSRLADGAVARAARLLAEWDDADQLLEPFAG